MEPSRAPIRTPGGTKTGRARRADMESSRAPIRTPAGMKTGRAAVRHGVRRPSAALARLRGLPRGRPRSRAADLWAGAEPRRWPAERPRQALRLVVPSGVFGARDLVFALLCAKRGKDEIPRSARNDNAWVAVLRQARRPAGAESPCAAGRSGGRSCCPAGRFQRSAGPQRRSGAADREAARQTAKPRGRICEGTKARHRPRARG